MSPSTVVRTPSNPEREDDSSTQTLSSRLIAPKYEVSRKTFRHSVFTRISQKGYPSKSCWLAEPVLALLHPVKP